MRLKRVYRSLLFLVLFSGTLWGQSVHYQNGKKYWVFFRDKGSGVAVEKGGVPEGLALGLSHRSLVRRAKVREKDKLIDETDLPVASGYIRALEDLGLKPRVISRWLNGISVVIPEEMMIRVQSLPFVRKIKPVSSFILKPLPPGVEKKGLVQPSGSHSLDYGPSYVQNNQIRVPEVHDLGITGRGVLVGMIDTGFDYRDWPVFSHLDVVAEHDFHWDDDNTANEDNDPSYQHRHGTMTLSVLGGFDEGQLVGPAYDASFALAKTEWIDTETRVEEDDWVAGIEWLEALGVDVVSSSLGYNFFDDGFSYAYEDLNGDSCRTTKAADIAASKGVVVVSSAGNERNDAWYYILSPADGDSVIAVGAVNSEGVIAGFSSAGPTYDGRIKPDVVAMGVSDYVFDPSYGDYRTANGTSFACPLVAGVCALVLQAHPELGPMEVREAIRETAHLVGEFPDNLYGWGLVDAYEAIYYHGMSFTNFDWVSLLDEGLERMDVEVLSRTGVESDSVFLFYRTGGMEQFQEVKMSYLDEENSHCFRTYFPSSVDVEDMTFYIEAVDTFGIEHVGPLGAPEVLYGFQDESSDDVLVVFELPKAFQFYQNYPNPFNLETTIGFDLYQESRVTLKIYNMLGREVVTLVDGVLDPGKKRIVWRGVDFQGQLVSSGIYFCEIKMGSMRGVRKMVLVK